MPEDEHEIEQSIIKKLDDLREQADNGAFFWRARRLQSLFGYDNWDNFLNAIERAKIACKTLGIDPRYHFTDASNMITIGKGGKRQKKDVALTRRACYLIAMNGDPRIHEIAVAQNYFVVQTRIKEIEDQNSELEGRIELRDQLKDSVKELNKEAQICGVEHFGLFTHAGYFGLYERGLDEIKAKKGINPKEQLFDNIGSQELAANYFKNTQAQAKLEREQVKGEQQAIKVHLDTAKEIRGFMRKLGSPMPEDLPAQPSLKRLSTPKHKPEQLPPA